MRVKKDIVNSGVRGTEDWNLRTEVGCTSIVPIIYPTMFKYLVPVIYSAGTPGDVVASGFGLVAGASSGQTPGILGILGQIPGILGQQFDQIP